MNRYAFTKPPRAFRRVRPDNLALVPASLLPFKAVHQQLANGLPAGTTLIVMPEAPGKPGQTFGNVATQIRAKGHQAEVVSSDRLAVRTLSRQFVRSKTDTVSTNLGSGQSPEGAQRACEWSTHEVG